MYQSQRLTVRKVRQPVNTKYTHHILETVTSGPETEAWKSKIPELKIDFKTLAWQVNAT
jgi:hypothetical protein